MAPPGPELMANMQKLVERETKAGILVLTVFALILDFIVTRIENRLLVWRPGTAETELL